MKISEKVHDDDGNRFVVQSTYDPNPTLQAAADIREQIQNSGEYRHIARLPGWLVEQWCKEAGVALHDVNARQEVMRKKLLSGEFNAFRTWEGSF